MAERDPVWEDPRTYDWDYALPPVRMSVQCWERAAEVLRKSGDILCRGAAQAIESQLAMERQAFDQEPPGAVFEVRFRKKDATWQP